jgi:cytochrome P450
MLMLMLSDYRAVTGTNILQNVDDMVYTRAVVKEVLRYRPPAVFVPQIAMQDVKLTDDYTVPKGSIVVPSLYAACMQGFPNAETFDPERMM